MLQINTLTALHFTVEYHALSTYVISSSILVPYYHCCDVDRR